MEKEFGKEQVHVYAELNLFTVHLKPIHCYSTTLQYKIKSFFKKKKNLTFEMTNVRIHNKMICQESKNSSKETSKF